MGFRVGSVGRGGRREQTAGCEMQSFGRDTLSIEYQQGIWRNRMPVAAFDTLKYAKHLRDAGFSDTQVDAQVAALSEAFQAGIQDLATKADIKDVKQEISQFRQETKSEFEKFRQETKSEFALVRQETKAGDNGLRQEAAQFRQEMKSEFEKLRQEMKNEFALVRQETKNEFALVRQEAKADIKDVRQEIAQLRQEMKSEFALVRQERALIRWMLGVVMSMCIAILVRLFFFH
jgi:hypothetical protein